MLTGMLYGSQYSRRRRPGKQTGDYRRCQQQR